MTGKVIGAAIEVHRALGPGLLESIYHECLRRELRIREIPFESQRSVPIIYKGTQLHSRFRLDLLIDSTLIVECNVKAIDGLLPIHHAQLLSYLRLTGLELGLLINFNVVLLKHGIKRIINSATSSANSASLR